MTRRKLEEKNIRKLGKAGGGTITVSLPIEIVRELKWKSKQKVVVKKKGSSVVITDWKE